jgi:ribose/xylose/arabinose/galactoside ABC-type transport system permease subunit
MNAFIATLGTGGVFGGLTVVYSEGRVIGPTAVTGPLPSWFSGRGSLGDFQEKVPLVVGLLAVAIVTAAMLISFDQRFPPPAGRRAARTGLLTGLGAAVVAGLWAVDVVATMSWTIVVLIAISTAVWVLLKYTGTGRSIYAVGGSVRAALFAGIRTDGITVFAFVVSGITAALAGVLHASVQGSAVPGIADALLLPAYASAFLSTVLISRGRFHVWGAVVGGVFLVYVASGLIRGGVAFTWTQVINGAVLVLTVSLSTFLRRR